MRREREERRERVLFVVNLHNRREVNLHLFVCGKEEEDALIVRCVLCSSSSLVRHRCRCRRVSCPVSICVCADVSNLKEEQKRDVH